MRLGIGMVGPGYPALPVAVLSTRGLGGHICTMAIVTLRISALTVQHAKYSERIKLILFRLTEDLKETVPNEPVNGIL